MRVTTRLYRALLIMGMLVSSVALAQGSSVITGTVTDAATGKPVPDVVVTAKSPALQGEQIVVTDSAGLFRLAQLPAGEYVIKLEKESYRPFSRSEIVVRTDRTVRVNVQVQPESVQSEQIVVVAKAPTVDVGNTATGINVGKEFINNIAFIRPTATGVRSFESLASVAPQVSSDQYGYGFSGATSPENLYVVDGVSVNDPGVGTNAATIPVDFIQEANIITGGYQAEYGRSGGGVINAVTKSGSNEFHGSVFANYTPGLLSPSSPTVQVAGQSAVTSDKVWNIVDFGAELGGPIIKDKLWFYVGVSPSWRRVQRSQYLNAFTIENAGTDDEAYATDELGNNITTRVPGSDRTLFRDYRTLSFIGKLTYLINSDNNLSLAVNGNYQDVHIPTFHDNWVGANFPDQTTTTSLKYAGGFLDKHLLVDVTLGWFHQNSAPNGLPDDGSTIGSAKGKSTVPQFVLTDSSLSITDQEHYSDSVIAACTAPAGASLVPCPLDNGAGYSIGGPGYMSLVSNDRLTAKASVAYLLSAAGHHIFKGGLDFDWTSYGLTKTYSGGIIARQTVRNGQAAIQDYRGYAYLTSPDTIQIQPVVKLAPTTLQVGGYLQDSWSIMDLVTLNLGLRYDNQILYDGSGKVGLALNNQLSPRVGLIYDFTNQGRSKIFANYARYYSSIPLDLADRSLSGEFQAGYYRKQSCNPTLDPTEALSAACQESSNWIYSGSQTAPSRYAFTSGSGRTAIDPNIQAGSKDEFTAGAEYEVLPDLRLGVTYTKSWVNRIIEDMSNDEANTYFIGNPGFGISTAFPKAVRDYDAVTVQATKAFSEGWMAQVSYTWSYLRGNWNGYYDADYQNQLDPGITAAFDLKSLLANQIGPLASDRTHFVKAYASKEFVIDNKVSLILGLSYEGASGTPISYLGRHPVYGDGQAFILPRGSAGRTSWMNTFNLKAGVGYRFDKDLGVQFAIDGLNIFNLATVVNVDQNYTYQNMLPYTGPNGTTAICANGATGCVPTASTSNVGADGTFDTMTASDINPNFKKPINQYGALAYQLPMQWRFSIKFTF